MFDGAIGGPNLVVVSHPEPFESAPLPRVEPSMRVQILEVDSLELPQLALTGTWAWLLFHHNGTLIGYSDGYRTRSACLAAARQIEWPVDVLV
jgi:hypothetical protein